MNPFVRAGVVLVVVSGGLIASTQLVYRDRAMPGVVVGSVNVGGKSKADIAQLVGERSTSLKQLTFRFQGTEYTAPAEDVGLSVDPDATATAAVAAGRSGLDAALTPSRLGFGQRDVRVVYRLNQDALKDKLATLTEEVGTPVRDARVVREGDTFRIARERAGEELNLNQAVRDARFQVEQFRSEVALRLEPVESTIRARDLTPARAYAEYLSSRPLNVLAGDRNFTVAPDRLASWVTFVRQERPLEQNRLAEANLVEPLATALYVSPDELPLPSPEPPTLRADLDREPIGQYVAEVADVVDRPPANARLGFANGQITISGQPKDGLVVDRALAVGAIAEGAKQPERVATVPITPKQADIRAETLAALGLTTRVGASTTTFGGSPANRTYNIGVGARRFDGVLIKPGEDFSFNQTLGDVGPETGYRPELVIKENKTAPEYGGGLCQVSTTMFRAALSSGLPITDRTNHSYAVHYYAPIGMDATIYPPNPDMRFKNNTGGHILVQTSMAGQSVTYEFYGTADGRTSRSEIIHISATEEDGGTASFRYIVEGGPEPINRVFSSSYKPRSSFPVSGERSLN